MRSERTPVDRLDFERPGIQRVTARQAVGVMRSLAVRREEMGMDAASAAEVVRGRAGAETVGREHVLAAQQRKILPLGGSVPPATPAATRTIARAPLPQRRLGLEGD